MASNVQIPTNPSDSFIKYGDTGPGVEFVQNFLQNNLPEVKKGQDLQESVGGDGWSFYDAKHKGIFENDTHFYLRQWQALNKGKIKSAGNLSDEQYQNEVGSIGYATAKAMGAIPSAAPTPEPAEPPVPTEDMPNETPPPPPPDAGASGRTHYVKTKNPKHRLALRLAPAMVKVSKNSWEDTGKKGKLVIMMPNDTVLRVVDPYLGYRCHWHQVLVLDESPLYDEVKELQKTRKVFCHAHLVEPFPEAPKLLPVRCLPCSNNRLLPQKRKTPFPSWSGLDDCEPFFDEYTCRYYIVTDIGDTSTSIGQIDEQKSRAMRIGIEALLSFYDKQRKEGDVEEYFNSLQFAMVPVGGVYLDERPGSTVKILVGVEAKFFDAIPRHADYLLDIPNLEGGNTPNGWKTFHFNSSTLRPSIQVVTDRFDEYQNDKKRWDAEVRELDFALESSRLKLFTGELNTLLKNNGFGAVEEEDRSIEIGFAGECFEIIYVLAESNGTMVPLRIGFDCFLKRDPMGFPRTMSYVFYLQAMADEIATREKRKWIDFVEDYACPPYPLRPGEPNPNDYPDVFPPVKKTTEKKQEDEKIELKKEKIYERRKDEFEFSGDDLLNCETLENTINEIQTLDDVYDKILNKTDLTQLAGLAASCIISRLLPGDLNNVACMQALKKLPVETLEKVILVLPNEEWFKVKQKIEDYDEMPVGIKPIDNYLILRQSLETAVDREALCRAISEVDSDIVPDILNKLKSSFSLDDLSLFQLNIPTIDIPDELFTEDIMSSIAGAIEGAVVGALSNLLITLIKSILRGICGSCDPTKPIGDENYGDHNLNDMFKSPNPPILDDLNIPPGILGDTGFRDMLDDLSNILLPSEICALLNGSANNEVLGVVLGLITAKYPPISAYIRSRDDVRKLFLQIGQYADPRVCIELNSSFNESQPDNCIYNTNLVDRNKLLQGRMSKEQLQEQLDAQRIEDIRKLQQMFDLIDGDILNDIIPPISPSDCRKLDAAQGSIVPHDPPSVEHLNQKVVDTIFDSVNMSFDGDMSGFVSLLIEQRRKNEAEGTSKQTDADRTEALEGGDDRKKVEVLSRDPFGHGINRQNLQTVAIPDVKRQLNSRASLTIDGEYSAKAEYYLLKSFFKQEKLQKLVENIKENIRKYNSDLNIPGEKISQEISGDSFKVALEKAICKAQGGTYEEENIITPPTILAKSLIKYKLPQFSGTLQELKDEFEITINNSGEAIYLFGNKPVPSDVNNAIAALKKNPTLATSLQQDVFAGLVEERWNKIFGESPHKSLLKYIREKMFHDIILDVIRGINNMIASSPLFEVSKLIEFKQFNSRSRDSSLSNCTVKSEDYNLLDIANAKESTIEDYDKLVTSCGRLGDSPGQTGSALEEVSINNLIRMIIRIHVIDRAMRGIFAYSTLNLGGNYQNNVVVQYLFTKTKEDLKRTGDTFYNSMAIRLKNFLLASGDTLSDPLAPLEEEIPTRMPQLSDELTSGYQTGESFVDYEIKKQLRDVLISLDKILVKPTKSIEEYFFDDVLGPPVDAPENLANEPYTYYTLTELDAGFETPVKQKVLEPKKNDRFNYKEGNFILQKYVRANGKVVQIEEFFTQLFSSQNREFSDNNAVSENICGNFGLRLIYLPSLDDGLRTIMRSFDAKNLKYMEERAYYLDKGYSYPIVLIEVEDDDPLDAEIGEKSYNFNQKINDLRQKMKETDEYKILFKYAFSLDTLATVSQIYSMELLGDNVDGLDFVFDSTKQTLQDLVRALLPTEDEWWKREDDQTRLRGGNRGIREEAMNNITTGGPRPSLASMAAMTIPILIKGLAENFDPAYASLKALFNSGVIDDLNWTQLMKIMPVNIFTPFGFGPPLTPLGAYALSTNLLPGEEKQRKRAQINKQGDKACEDPTGDEEN